MSRILKFLVPAFFVLSAAHAGAQEKLPDSVAEKLEALSGLPSNLAALQLGITNIQGKPTDPSPSGPPGNAQSPKLRDVAIADTAANENETNVVANPVDKKYLVASSHRYPTFPIRCVAYASSDGGKSWSAGVPMQQLSPSHDCSDPVLAYAPDGSRVYMAYMDIFGGTWDILVSHSDDNGVTWSAPVIALQGNPAAFIYDKPWIATHSFDASQSALVYVTATRFSVVSSPDHIAFSRSTDGGLTFNSASPTLFDSASAPVVVQGSHPAAGPGSDVVVAWYNSGADGWLNGGFQIKVAHSSDNGATFDPPVIAAAESCCELPFWLGPSAFYHRWWGGMFPAAAIDGKGGAHIAYAFTPVNQNTAAGRSSTESGDIRYITSSSAPYTVWSAPLTVNDDGLLRAQGFPAIAAREDGTVWLSWEDHRLSPAVATAFPNSSNLFYDNFVARKAPGQNTFFTNLRASDRSSLSQKTFIGDYTGIAVNATTTYAVWTDRRNRTNILDSNNDVFGSRVIAGGGTP
ncbi:sialidase family protein [Cupriavidus sp. TMH.W2]|uniref:sialidase family protein n=1 Tax=Cupriavidus sp. TMH.W2 TaxID=3434465 RepID=UPI003D76DF75